MTACRLAMPLPACSAGFWYGLWGTLLTAYGFALGGLIDYLGEWMLASRL